MANKTPYTDEQKAAYKAGLAAAKKKGGRSGSASTRTTTRRKGKAKAAPRSKGTPKRASGCIYYNDHNGKGEPKIFAWRYFGKGANRKKMEMNAYWSKDKGQAGTGTSTDVGRVFVCNIVIVGESSSTQTGWWSEQYEKLTISNLGLVANPKLSGGGYFGKGGSRYKDKVK